MSLSVGVEMECLRLPYRESLQCIVQPLCPAGPVSSLRLRGTEGSEECSDSLLPPLYLRQNRRTETLNEWCGVDGSVERTGLWRGWEEVSH